MTRLAGQIMNEGLEAGFRIGINAGTNETYYDFTLTPKPGTPLAATIAEWKPSTTPLAGMISKETAAYYTLQLPVFAPEIGDIADTGMAALAAEASQNAPPTGKPVIEAICKGLGRTFKAGHGDLAIVLNSPNKDGHYTALVGVTFDDPSEVEKALRAAIKELPEFARKIVTFDADKAGKVGLHVVKTSGSELPEAMTNIFGPDVPIVVAFAPKAIFLGVGPNALTAVKAAVLAPPGEAKALEMGMNPEKILPLIRSFNPAVTAEHFKRLPIEQDKLSSLGSSMITGGRALTLRTTSKMLNFNWLLAPVPPVD